MDWNEVIENLKYLISEDCTDTQFDYADEIEIAIRVMESQEDLRSKIDKAIEEIEQVKSVMNEEIIEHDRKDLINFINGINQCLIILKENIGE